MREAPVLKVAFAHSRADAPLDEWEKLAVHLRAVGERAAAFADAFGCAEAGRAMGQLHDIGKCSDAFTAYISGKRAKGPDHSTAGARVAVEQYGKPLGRLIGFGIAGHHAGLADFKNLEERLAPDTLIEDFSGWQAHAGDLPSARALIGRAFTPGDDAGFSQSFLARMLFSCLVDADFLETERFYAKAGRERGGFCGLAELRDRLRMDMARKQANSAPSDINFWRREILEHVIAKAADPPGVFTLTVPTGGGKTLASLSFALDHAVCKNKRRIVYVIPYTSIIEQTADVFRNALATQDDILEHHASFDWEQPKRVHGGDDEGRDGLGKLKLAAENWDAPIIVTTAVQFFESLFAARPSRCRKLHNLADSVIVLDEAQTLPVKLLRPCVAALKELAANYGASVVLCTATQPALRAIDGFEKGFGIDDSRELAPSPRALYTRFKRVEVTCRTVPVAVDEIAEAFAGCVQMLCIVNRRASAREIFERIAPLPGAVHLSTLMCPRHRRLVLADLRARLAAGLPVRLVATSLIEAGVDISFPEVWREATGLDSIAQAAGRCNREGLLERGNVVVFELDGAKLGPSLAPLWSATQTALRQHGDDPLGLDAVQAYFGELYWQKGDAALDAATFDGKPWPILPHIREGALDLSFPFNSIARAFRMIDDTMVPVIVPWRANEEDDAAERLLGRIAAMERPLIGDLRQLQQYTVPIPRILREAWLARGVLAPVHRALGADLLRFADMAHYDAKLGVNIRDSTLRDTNSNVIGD